MGSSYFRGPQRILFSVFLSMLCLGAGYFIQLRLGKDETRSQTAKERLTMYEAKHPPDFRHPRCHRKHPDRPKYPKVYVVIPYYKESWQHVFYTISSLLSTTRMSLVKEILFVSDGNPPEWEFDVELLQLHKKIRHIRHSTSLGVAAVKNSAISHYRDVSSPTDVIVFSEPHTLYNKGWLEPLLDAIVKEPNTMAVPILDNIQDAEFHRYDKTRPQYGGFDWSLTFLFRDFIEVRNASWLDPENFPTPASSGGIFAIRLQYISNLGGYDPLITSWGGENSEMSIKVWTCYGQILNVPCSRVGHNFRSENQKNYAVDVRHRMRNVKRIAKVWLDDHYAKFIQIHEEDAMNPFEIDEIEEGNLEEREELRKKLKCRNFDWYIDNVYPELRTQPLQLPLMYDPHTAKVPERTRDYED